MKITIRPNVVSPSFNPFWPSEDHGSMTLFVRSGEISESVIVPCGHVLYLAWEEVFLPDVTTVRGLVVGIKNISASEVRKVCTHGADTVEGNPFIALAPLHGRAFLAPKEGTAWLIL